MVAPSAASLLDEASRFTAEIERTIAEEDLLPHLILLEPLFRRAGAAQVAAALGHLVRKRVREVGSTHTDRDARSESVSRPPSWARLFLSVGEKDGITTRDLLGAILGESGIAGEQVGKIDLRETFTKVEVQEQVAEKVIRALNGTSIRGRSVRADFDRGETVRSAPRSSGGARGKGEGRPRSGIGGKGDAPYKGSGRPTSPGGGKSGGPFRKGKPESGGKPRRTDSPKPRRPG
jgi:ATP-dependent RNA helicase DeaD